MKRFLLGWVLLLCVMNTVLASQRLKEIANIGGVRPNQLIGYGLVVGLDGSGDKVSSSPFTGQSMSNMLNQLGVQIPAGTKLDPKNVAAVSLTATLPPFARRGQAIDVTASSIGDAKSLRGGTLLLSPLKGADGQVYAMAQGNVVVGGAGASAGGSKAQVNQLSVGRIPA
ncbi:flagellar basal body P-ring protein FlgI [Paludibacterium denitrificans]|uniref:flagellar basal body P-ring protein FlgI n=1 Tax=Paludibacterium denitrificans TaxID=2675226 RepID=UPI002477FA91|nr:flagellar basal body P-ring protein FlgI [Paludibacterium denitrificans]